MEKLPQLYYFEQALEKGLPQQDESFENASGRLLLGLGVASAGAGAALFAKDLIDKKKAKKEAQKKAEQEAAQALAEEQAKKDELIKNLQQQVQQQQNNNNQEGGGDDKNKTLMYVGIGVVVLVVLGVLVAITRRN